MAKPARKRPRLPDTPMCSAPGCPLRWIKPQNDGNAYCRFHRGVQDPQRVSEITRRIHINRPVFEQVRILTQLNASQLMGDEPVAVVDGLPVPCRQRDGEAYAAWRERLRRWLELSIRQTEAA